jgi:chloramphenicol 3-O-phosphotransferase
MAGARDGHTGPGDAWVFADAGGGIEFASDGAVIVGPEFRLLEAAWICGIAAMAGAGARVIVDEVFLGGAASQQRWKTALGPLPVLWVGVRCESTVAEGREIARGDRIIGMAAAQADVSTRVSSMTWRWTRRTPRPGNARRQSPPTRIEHRTR